MNMIGLMFSRNFREYFSAWLWNSFLYLPCQRVSLLIMMLLIAVVCFADHEDSDIEQTRAFSEVILRLLQESDNLVFQAVSPLHFIFCRWLLRVPICCLASAYLCIVTYMSEVKFFWNFLCLKKLVSAALQVPICCSRSCCHRYCRSCCCCCCHRCSRSCCCCCRSCCSCCCCCHHCSRSCCCCCRSCCSCCFRCCCRSCCCCCSFSYASLTLRKQN